MITAGRLEKALDLACGHLLERRLPEGFWEGRLSSSALSTATAVSALSLAGCAGDEDLIRAGVHWLAAHQNGDGSWGDTPDSPGNLATTLLGLSALTLAGDESAAATRAAAAAREWVDGRAGDGEGAVVRAIRDRYGGDRTFAVPILMNCAAAGLVSWEDVPGLPFELAALPQGLYRALRLQVVSYALPALIAVGTGVHAQGARRGVRAALRRMAMPVVRRKLRHLQPESGGFLEATPLTAFVMMGLLGQVGPGDAVVQEGLGFLRASMREDGSWPIDTNLAVWVTTGAVNALSCAGRLTPPVAAAARRWIAACQFRHTHPYTGAAPGGWGWTHLPGSVPDADDTSGAVLALAGTDYENAAQAGRGWLVALQNADGGWPTFCRGWGKLPFDQSCPDITAHALRALGATGVGSVGRAVARGLAYLRRKQSPEGSWAPLWFGNQGAPGQENPVYGTSRVLLALATVEPEGEMARRGVQWLTDAQNADGGWGGARGVPSSVEETAVAVSALARWPEEAPAALERGLEHLLDKVESGGRPQPAPIGLYFASLWYHEELYPEIWTVEALGRARAVLPS